ncbi:MAG TPA: AI-2E family transporter [Candidatus Methylomirabilis sp.]|nr:AI-2E family transporter [Candidatus Methylomirabilis sp.]
MQSAVRMLRPFVIVASLVLVIACLYWAQAVLIPIALSILLTFLLSPIVGALERLRLGRMPSVILVAVLSFSLLGGIGWAIAPQITSLANDLPKYTKNIKKKIGDLRRAGKGTSLEKVQVTVKEVMEEIEKEGRAAVNEEKPVPVVVQAPSLLWKLPSLLELLAMAGLVIALVVFMLIERHELRNRLIRLVGYGRLTSTTKALDDAAQRISHYLLMQSIINGSFGLAVGLGLFFIGVPYAILWGFLAAALRFLPYVGPLLAAILPITLSLAAFKGWVQPILVIGLFIVVELFSNLVMETWLYSQSAGISEVALLVAVAFWTWLWGPLGLLLATPLTVCLVVLGKYVPHMEFIGVLMGDEPVMETNVNYYQRLLAKDRDEAAAIVEEYLRTHPVEQVYDDMLVAALSHAKRDRDSLTEDDEQFIFRATRKIVEDLSSRQPGIPASAEASEAVVDENVAALPKVRILDCPARDQADELALLMLRQLLDSLRCEFELISAEMHASEVVSVVEEKSLAVVCIGAVMPGGLADARYLCKRLRARFPDLKIVVGRWGFQGTVDEDRNLLLSEGADHVGTSLLESRNQMMQLIHVLCHTEPRSSPNSS